MSNDRHTYAVTLFNQMSETHGLRGWKFTYDHARTRAGCCNHTSRTISLSKYMVLNPKITKTEIKNTLLHEMAHALVGAEHHHDAVWKAKAIEIGCTGDRCHALELTDRYNYKIECPCGSFSATRMVMKNVNRWLMSKCKACNGNLKVFKITRVTV